MRNSPNSANCRLKKNAAASTSRMARHISIIQTTKGKLPRLPFRKIAEAVLPDGYTLEIVVIGDQKSRALNRTYRKKDLPTNVLSFPLSKHEGELFLNPRQARRDAPSFDMPYETFLCYLVIHGLLHLAGFRHGSKMSQAETKLLQRFNT